MESLSIQLQKQLGHERVSLLAVASPWSKYLFLLALWAVVFETGIKSCLAVYFVFLCAFIAGRTNPFSAVFVLVLVGIATIGHAVFSMINTNHIGVDTLKFAVKAHIMFGSPALLFSQSPAIQHFYAWSAVVGPTVAAGILSFMRVLFFFPEVVRDTKDAFTVRARGPLRNPLSFVVTLLASGLSFTRNYADTLHVRDMYTRRGYDDYGDGFSSADIMVLVLSFASIVIVWKG